MAGDAEKALEVVCKYVAGGQVAADAVDIAMRMHEAGSKDKDKEEE